MQLHLYCRIKHEQLLFCWLKTKTTPKNTKEICVSHICRNKLCESHWPGNLYSFIDEQQEEQANYFLSRSALKKSNLKQKVQSQ